MRGVRLFLAVICAAAAATTARADPAERAWPAGTFTVQIENDRIANTDRHYTHGSRISWVSDQSSTGPDWAKNLLEKLYPLADLRWGRAGFSLGQSIFTPEDTDAVELVRDDRPYAGWLYLGASVHAETRRTDLGIEFDTLDSVELDIGVVGPYSLAEDTQNTYHELIDVSRSNGWDNQLENEPGIMMVFERKWRPEPLRIAGLELDAIPHIGGAVGNVMTLAHAGGTVRVGQHLAIDYGPALIRPALSGIEAIADERGFGWYLFAGVDGRAVAHNIFLDGNTFADSHSVDRRIFVGDFQLGVSAYYRNIRLSFTHVMRTREFDGQRLGDRYGSLALSVRY